MMKRKALVLIAFLMAFAACAGCDRRDPEAGSAGAGVVVAVTPWPGSAALYVAREKGYFEDEGIEVTFEPYVSGHLGLDAALAGKVDLTTAGDTPVAHAVVRGRPVAVLATICEINRAVLVVARKDRGISSLRDLRGRRVGVVEGTTADFFLHILLSTSYVKPEEVRIVGLETEAVVDALLRGEVDAVSTWSPHTTRAMKGLGDRGVAFDDPAIYKMTWNLASSTAYAEAHPERIRRVLRAVVRANAFIREHPEEALDLVSGRIGAARSELVREWKDFSFVATLDQGLLLNLEDQARWMMRKEAPQPPPNFMESIRPQMLRAVEPSAIGIVTGRDKS